MFSIKLDFIIAEKSGTTFLTDTLRRSDRVMIPQREVRYFRDPFYPTRERLDEFFPAATGDRILGIKHPSYLGRAKVPERIHAHNPSVKLIFILRDPVDRAISAYQHYIVHGQIPPLHPNIGIPLLLDEPDASPKYRDILDFGLYARHLSSYFDLFDRTQVLVLEYREFFRRRRMAAIFDFLEIDPVPTGSFPRINAGIYDWKQSLLQFYDATRVNRSDDQMNIVEKNPAAPPAAAQQASNRLRQELPPQSIEVEDRVRMLLRRYYQRDLDELRRMDVVDSGGWMNSDLQ